MTALALPDLADQLITVDSVLFGTLRLPAASRLHFPDGLLGFPQARDYVLLPAAADGIYWLQAIGAPRLVFVVVDPFAFVPGYVVAAEPPAPARAADGALAVLAVVTLPGGPGEPCTANLQGPLLVDLAARTGWQVLLDAAAWTTRHPLDLAARLAAHSSSQTDRR